MVPPALVKPMFFMGIMGILIVETNQSLGVLGIFAANGGFRAAPSRYPIDPLASGGRLRYLVTRAAAETVVWDRA